MSVHVLALPGLQPCSKDVLGGEVVPRSLLFSTLGSERYLLGGLGDGHLVTWRCDPSLKQISQRKKIPLATQPGMQFLLSSLCEAQSSQRTLTSSFIASIPLGQHYSCFCMLRSAHSYLCRTSDRKASLFKRQLT